MKLKSSLKKCHGFAHIYLRLLNPLLYGAPHTKVGLKRLIHVATIIP